MNPRHFVLGTALVACLASIGFVLTVPVEEEEPGAYAIESADVTFHNAKPAGEVSLVRFDGTPVTTADLKGKVVVVDVWATWCAPCITEIPHYNELVARYENADVEFLAVTVQSGKQADVERFIAGLDTSIEYPLTMGTDGFEDEFGPLWALPTTYLIGPEWQVRKTWIGILPTKQAELRVLIDRLLEEKGV